MTQSAIYSLAPTTPTTGLTGGGVGLVESPDIFGFGLLAPFRRASADFGNAGGITHLQSMIGQVLGTMGGSDYTEGELPWRTEFGSLLHFLRHKQNDEVLSELARVYVAQALARWIPQILILEVRTEKKDSDSASENVLEIRIKYRVKSLNQIGNEVLSRPLSQSVYFSM